MKKWICMLLTCVMLLGLCACGKTQPPAAAEPEEKPQETPDAPVTLRIDPVGPWHLDSEKNDLKAFQDAFPGYAEFGAGMEIRSNGQLSWFIGAEGGTGTWHAQDAETLVAELTADVEQKPLTSVMQVVEETGTAFLVMTHNGETVYWAFGDSEEIPAAGNEDAEPAEGTEAVCPGEDVVKIVNQRGDTTTVYKLADGRYMDRIERIFIFDGVGTWTDPDGAAWDQAVD